MLANCSSPSTECVSSSSSSTAVFSLSTRNPAHSDTAFEMSETSTVCEDGALRLSTESCDEEARIVEECISENWVPTEECRKPDDCVSGELRETAELCRDSEYWYNRRLVRCEGELLQPAGCTCGSEAPMQISNSSGVEDGVTFGEIIVSSDSRPEGTAQLKCVHDLLGRWPTKGEVVFPDFSSLVAGSIITFNKDGSLDLLKSLSTVGFLTVTTNASNLKALASLEEARRLSLRGNLTSLEGLTSLHTLRGLRLEVLDELLSVEGLAAITRLEEHLFIGQVPLLESYAGLDNIEFIGGDMELPIRSEDDLSYLAKLKKVGGSVDLRVPLTTNSRDYEVECLALKHFSNVEIGGEFTIRGGVFDPSLCE